MSYDLLIVQVCYITDLVTQYHIKWIIKQKYKPFQYLGSYGSSTDKRLVVLDVHFEEVLQILEVCHSNVSSVEFNTQR